MARLEPLLLLLAIGTCAGVQFSAGHKYWKVANGGTTPWRPAVHTLRMSKSKDCSNPVSISGTMVSASGTSSDGTTANSGPHLTVDSSVSTAWRAQCQPCAKGAAWLRATFTGNVTIRCAEAFGLGVVTGNNGWTGGVTLWW